MQYFLINRMIEIFFKNPVLTECGAIHCVPQWRQASLPQPKRRPCRMYSAVWTETAHSPLPHSSAWRNKSPNRAPEGATPPADIRSPGSGAHGPCIRKKPQWTQLPEMRPICSLQTAFGWSDRQTTPMRRQIHRSKSPHRGYCTPIQMPRLPRKPTGRVRKSPVSAPCRAPLTAQLSGPPQRPVQ